MARSFLANYWNGARHYSKFTRYASRNNREHSCYVGWTASHLAAARFFTHTLAYAWVSQKATTAKATATALYLVHYYVGGSIGGFFLLYCWQHGKWTSVVEGGLVLYIALFALCWKLAKLERAEQTTVLVADSR